MIFGNILSHEVEHLVKIFVKIEGCAFCVLVPTRNLGGTDNTHFIHTHFVKEPRRGEHRFDIPSMHVGLRFDTEAVIHAEFDRTERIFFRALTVSEPIVMPDTVKGNLDQRIASDLLHAVKHSLIYVKSVGVQFLNEHSALINALNDGQKVLVAHRFTARDGEGVDTALLCFIKQFFGFFKRKFSHQGRIIRCVEAMQTVIVALACNHKVHRRKIAVVTVHLLPRIKASRAHLASGDHSSLNEALHKRTVGYLGLPVTEREQFKFFFCQPLRVTHTFYVIGIRHAPP